MALRLGSRAFAPLRLISFSQHRCLNLVGVVPRMAWADRSFGTAATKQASTKSRSSKSKSGKSSAKKTKVKKETKMKERKSKKGGTKKERKSKSKKSTKKSTAKGRPKKEKLTKVEEVPKKRGRSKAVPLGPAKPKRPESAFLLYVRQQRETNPEYKKFATSPTDQAKRAGIEWKALSEADKKTWNDQAEVKKKQHEERKKVYEKDRRPKKPLTAFLLYSEEKRASHTGPVSEVAKKIGAEWKKLSEADKQPYLTKSKAAMSAWKQQCEDWEKVWMKKKATA